MTRNLDYFEASRLKYTKRGLLFTIIMLFVLAIANFYLREKDAILISIAFFVALSAYIYVLKTKNLILPGYVLISIGYLLVTYSLITNYRYENILDSFWLLNLTIVAFYLLKRKVGLVFLAVSTLTLVTIKLLTMEGYISHDVRDTDAFNPVFFITNAVVCISLLGYLFNQIISISNDSQRELILTNERILEQNKEKTIMLKEIHHRVKNNLQVITSLLRLQLYRLDDEKIIILFQESINRISTMALIHAKMYQGDSINNLNLKSYVQDLAADLIRTYSTQHDIRIQIRSMVKELDLTNLVPFSLIINELVTNSIKHGFKEQSVGEISIDINDCTEHIELIYKDSGLWQAPTNDNSFGLELITTLTEQFNGSYEIDKTDGTTFHFKLFIQ